jgi:hypothetical protein
MFKFLDGFKKVENTMTGELPYSEIYKLVNNDDILVDSNSMSMQTIEFNGQSLSVPLVDKEVINEIEDLILSKKFVGSPIILSLSNNSKLKIVDGFDTLMAIKRIMDNNSEEFENNTVSLIIRSK